jgi:hypothetical protein
MLPYGETIRQLCVAPVWADNQTTVCCTCMGRQSDNCVLQLYVETDNCIASVWGDRQLCVAHLWGDNQATVCCTSMGRQSGNCVLQNFPLPPLPYQNCVQQFIFACNRQQDCMSMLHPHSMTTIAMQHNSTHYFATQNNRPGLYSQLNKNGTSDKPLHAIQLHTATQHRCVNKQEMAQSPSNHTT